MDWDISSTKAANLTTQLKVPTQFFIYWYETFCKVL